MFFKLLKDWNGQKAGTQLALSDADAAPLVQAGIMEIVRDDPPPRVPVRRPQPGQEFAAKQATQHTHRQEETRPTGDPTRRFLDATVDVTGTTAAGDDTVHVRMMAQRLTPRVQHRQ